MKNYIDENGNTVLESEFKTKTTENIEKSFNLDKFLNRLDIAEEKISKIRSDGKCFFTKQDILKLVEECKE